MVCPLCMNERSLAIVWLYFTRRLRVLFNAEKREGFSLPIAQLVAPLAHKPFLMHPNYVISSEQAESCSSGRRFSHDPNRVIYCGGRLSTEVVSFRSNYDLVRLRSDSDPVPP